MSSAELEKCPFPYLMLSLRISHQPTCLTLGSYKACSFTWTSLWWTGGFRSMGQHLQKQFPGQFEWQYLFLAQEKVFSLPPGVIHDLGTLGLSWRRDMQVCNWNKRQSAYVRPSWTFNSITDSKSKLQAWLSHRHCQSSSRMCSLLSTPLLWGTFGGCPESACV